MTVLVYGLGRSGLAVTRLLTRQGHSVEFMDSRADGPDISAAQELGARRLNGITESNAELVIAAPGVPIDHPDLVAAQAAGLEVTGEVQWVHDTFEARLVGVTGTAGKGTVTSWITRILNRAGLSAVAGGNIDPALAEVARDGAILVTELSSFQLERSLRLDPAVAVILNLAEDHLDRHGTIERYHAAKRNVLNRLSPDHLFVYNADDPLLSGWAKSHMGRTAGFSLTGPADAWLDGNILMVHGKPLMAAETLQLTGRHNIANALAVALACVELGVKVPDLVKGLSEFEGLAGRYSTVTTISSITFIEDSIATRPLAVRAALEASPTPLVWIAGGQNKGADIREFRELAAERVDLFIGIGASGPEFCTGLRDSVPVIAVTEPDGRLALRKAIQLAFQHLHGHSVRTGTILLAPLAASFDQFSDYRERARVYREEIALLEETWIPSS